LGFLEHLGWEWLNMLGQCAGVVLDLITFALLTYCLGFSFILLSAMGLEAVPGLDLAPSWAGAVAIIVWQRLKENGDSSTMPLPGLSELKDFASNALRTAQRAIPAARPKDTAIEVEAQPLSSPHLSLEERLRHLDELRDKGLVSPSEYEIKREKMLDEV
jgi:hypothetical protein